MAGSFGDYFENQVLNAITGRAGISQMTLYLALFTAPPSDSGGGTEVSTSGTGYARVQLNTPPSTNPYFGTAAASGQIANTAQISFATPTASWGTIVAIGIYDAATGGNLLAWATVPAQTVNANDPPVKFPVGAIVLSLD